MKVKVKKITTKEEEEEIDITFPIYGYISEEFSEKLYKITEKGIFTIDKNSFHFDYKLNFIPFHKFVVFIPEKFLLYLDNSYKKDFEDCVDELIKIFKQ